AVGVERGQRLVEDPGAVVVLYPHREVAVQDAHRLPPERPELAAPAPLGGGERRLGLGLGPPGRLEHLRGPGRGEAEADHRAGELPPAQRALLDLADELPERVFIHVFVPPGRYASRHLLSFDATSAEPNWSMKRCGSGWVMVEPSSMGASLRHARRGADLGPEGTGPPAHATGSYAIGARPRGTRWRASRSPSPRR